VYNGCVRLYIVTAGSLHPAASDTSLCQPPFAFHQRRPASISSSIIKLFTTQTITWLMITDSLIILLQGIHKSVAYGVAYASLAH